MQLYALDPLHKKPVSAHVAIKQRDYLCAECNDLVRVRKGLFRQAHFYHIGAKSNCHQSGKSLEHLQLQNYFLQHLPADECVLEQQFPEIQRIADVVWRSKKIIFEIQCSYITAEEVQSRNQDYTRLGYTVVWILHEKTFSRRRLTAAERLLRNSPHYYTNFNSQGKGYIYDQLVLSDQGWQRQIGKPTVVNFMKPEVCSSKKAVHPLPKIIRERLSSWAIYFMGDHIERCLQDPHHAVHILQQENSFNKPSKQTPGLFYTYFVRPYLLGLQMLLERCSK